MMNPKTRMPRQRNKDLNPFIAQILPRINTCVNTHRFSWISAPKRVSGRFKFLRIKCLTKDGIGCIFMSEKSDHETKIIQIREYRLHKIRTRWLPDHSWHE